MQWVWRILFVCVVLGGAQWFHAHPDSEMTKQVMEFFAQVRAAWHNFVGAFADYVDHFPTYMRNMLDTTPKPHGV